MNPAIPETMKAAAIDRFGGPEVIHTRSLPVPKPDAYEVLIRLGAEDNTAAQVAHLHLFGGLSVEEAGDVLGLSRPVAYRNWKFARAWLREALEK